MGSPQQNSGGGKRRYFYGPCYLKLLVNNLVAGSIIGKNGAVIASIEQTTGCTLKLSPTNSFFPGTNDRVVALSGTQEQIDGALDIIVDKIKEVAAQHSMESPSPQQNNRPVVKVALPKSAVSALIGKGGNQIKSLQESTGAKVKVSDREEGMHERIVTVSGAAECMHNAARAVAASVQCDPNLKDHMYVTYNKMGNMYPSPGGIGGGNCGGQGPMYGQQFNPPNFGGGCMPQQPQFGGPEVMQSRCEITLHIPEKHVGAVIGRNGSCLSDIMKSSGAQIQISNKGEVIPGTTDRKCVVLGSLAAVHKAHYMLMHRVETSEWQQSMKNQSQGGGGGCL